MPNIFDAKDEFDTLLTNAGFLVNPSTENLELNAEDKMIFTNLGTTLPGIPSSTNSTTRNVIYEIVMYAKETNGGNTKEQNLGEMFDEVEVAMMNAFKNPFPAGVINLTPGEGVLDGTTDNDVLSAGIMTYTIN